MIYYSNLEEDLYTLAKFVVEQNYNHHTTVQPENLCEEIDSVYREEYSLTNSKVFIASTSENQIIGSIRVLKWNFIDCLPIKNVFDIDPLSLYEDNEIYHIGRFAINGGGENSGFKVFKTLMTYAINEVCKTPDSIALAECDVKLLNVIKLLGIEVKILAKSKLYLGSETIPVLLSYSSLRNFLSKNKELIKQDHKNYTFA